MAEAIDWIRTVDERCPLCGYDAASVERPVLGLMLDFEAAAWRDWLLRADQTDLRVRPDDLTWSALEYACHVRDLLGVMTERVDRLREGDLSPLGWWDHEAAVEAAAYNDQPVPTVADDLATRAAVFAASFVDVEGDVWDRAAERRPGERFTLDALVRFTLHELHHHRIDAMSSAGQHPGFRPG